MDSLVADWCSCGHFHFLIFADRCSGYVWAQQYKEMSTSNAIKMLTSISLNHSKPLEVTTDAGPSFRQTFSEHCQTNFISHHHSAAYRPSDNGKAERSVGLLKDMIEKNAPLTEKTLQSLCSALNYRGTSITGGGSASMRLTGLKPRLGLPTLAPVLSEEQKESMHLAMREHRIKRKRALRNTTHTEQKIGTKSSSSIPKRKALWRKEK